MFKKPTKRQLLIRRILLSSVATLSVVIIATVTILLMLGFTLNSKDGTLEQGALLQFDSKPNGANVVVDGTDIGSKTSTKKTVVSGTHTVKMWKTGYQDWTRTLTLEAGTLTWLDYTRFVPKERPVETVATYSELNAIAFTNDNKWALAQNSVTAPHFQLIDLRSETVKSTTLDIPASVYSEAGDVTVAHSFSVVSWDDGGRYVLIKHIYSNNTEWLVLDTQNASRTVNITQLLNADFKDVQFASTNGQVFYGLTTDGTIRKLDLSAGTLSRAYVTHVESFSTYYDKKVLSYIGISANDATKRVAGIYRDGDDTSHVLRTVSNLETSLKIVSSEYFDDTTYVAIAEDSIVTILKGSYPSANDTNNSSLEKLATLTISGTVSNLTFSPEGGYVLAQSGDSYKTYEIEHKRTAAGMIASPEGQVVPTLKWLDIAHLYNDEGNKLMMRDFDGSNIYSIMAIEPGFSASLSQNGRFFYAIGKDDKGYHLQRVKMILD